MQLSEHVSLADATASQTAARKGLNNQPPPELIPVLRNTANGIYEPLWYAADGQIRLSSFYRSPSVNAAVGGSKTSQHMAGEAMDLQATGDLTNLQLLELVRKTLKTWDQLINEYPNAQGEGAWVHVSLRKVGNRKQELTIGSR